MELAPRPVALNGVVPPKMGDGEQLAAVGSGRDGLPGLACPWLAAVAVDVREVRAPLNVGSLFSGIGGIDLGLERAGMRVLFQAEANEWRRSVLRTHWPDIPCYADVRDVGQGAEGARPGRLRAVGTVGNDEHPVSEGRDGPSDDRLGLLCGGFPCQDVSVAGRRAGLSGARSSLFFEFARVADAFRPRWLLIENVPGLLSSNSGRDFAIVLSTLADLGYGVAWRVLDSRYFGVPQRRRRVFVVGHLGADGAAPFLPFLEGGAGHLKAGGEAGAGAAGASAVSTLQGGGKRGYRVDAEGAAGGHLVTGFHHIQDPISSETVSPALGQEGMAVMGTLREHVRAGSNTDHSIVADQAVRRLTPTECCRLQGFPDDWLGLPNEPPDSPRYAALGDAVTVPVAEWIGRRILEADQAMKEAA